MPDAVMGQPSQMGWLHMTYNRQPEIGTINFPYAFNACQIKEGDIKEYYKFRNGIDKRDGIKRHAGVLMNPIVRVVPKTKGYQEQRDTMGYEPEDEDQGDCQVVEPAGPKRGKIRPSQCQAPTQPGSLDQWISRNQRGATPDDESPARPFSRPLSQEARPFSRPLSHVIDFMKFLDSKKVIFYNKEKDYTDGIANTTHDRMEWASMKKTTTYDPMNWAMNSKMADSVSNEDLKKFGEELLGQVAELMKGAGSESKKKEREAEEEKSPKVSSKGIQKNLDFNFKIKNILTKAAANGTLEEAVKEVQDLLKARNGELLLLDSDPNLLQTKEKLDALKAIAGVDSEGSSTQSDMTSILLLSNLAGNSGNRSGGFHGESKRRRAEPYAQRQPWFRHESTFRGQGSARQNGGQGFGGGRGGKGGVKCFKCSQYGHYATEYEKFTWLGYECDLVAREVRGTEKRIAKWQAALEELRRSVAPTVLDRMKFLGCLASFELVAGDVGVGRARCLMQTVGESQRRKSELATVKRKKTPGEEREIEFWRERGRELLKRSQVEIEPKFHLFLYTDASARGIGAVLKNERDEVLWKMSELGDSDFERESSAWRELTAVKRAAEELVGKVNGNIKVLVDSQAAVKGAKRQFVEELKQKAGEGFEHHIERLKMIPFEAKATSTAAAYKAENDKRNSWISRKKLPMDESSFLLYLVDRARQIGSSALAKISAAYQTANEGISAIGASFVSDIIKSKRREESLLKKTVVEVTVEDVQKITMLAIKEDSPERDRDALLAILSFNVMLRASEAAEIKWAGVTQRNGMIEVHVEKAKNDQLRLGRSSFLNYEPGSDADILMCRWRLRTKGKCPYVFSHLNSSKKLSKGAISTLLTKMLAAIGKPGATHHCFRRGGANHMRRIGHSMEEIQCRGRWRSAAGLKAYLTDVPTAQGCLQSKGAEVDDEDDDD
ncbi:unnamed protein product [Caenorhabditis nigoni]